MAKPALERLGIVAGGRTEPVDYQQHLTSRRKWAWRTIGRWGSVIVSHGRGRIVGVQNR